ncbi:MAG: hypothetical protein AAGC55_15605 [Myxococcota bacterium]
MIKKFCAILFCASLLIACGGDDDDDGIGVDRDTLAADLTEDELRSVCEFTIGETGGEGATADCGGGVTLENGTVSECVADGTTPFAGCTLTVGQLEDCVVALEGDNCALFTSAPTACQEFLDCTFTQVRTDGDTIISLPGSLSATLGTPTAR